MIRPHQILCKDCKYFRPASVSNDTDFANAKGTCTRVVIEVAKTDGCSKGVVKEYLKYYLELRR